MHLAVGKEREKETRMVVKRGRDLTEEKEKNQFETFGEREGEQRCKD